MQPSGLPVAAALAAALTVLAAPAGAHGIVGSRFFPATLAVEDPFVADELALPTIASLRRAATGEAPSTRETEISFEYARRITPAFGMMLGQGFHVLDPRGGRRRSGFGNLEVGGRYQFLTDPEREAVASFSLVFDLGGTGARQAEAERFSTVTPTLAFGKGFGDLPETLPWLRPIALTGTIGYAVPLSGRSSRTVADPDRGGALVLERERNPEILRTGLTLQYSLPYLQSNVRDLGLGPLLGRLVPLVELALDTPVQPGGGTTGSVNPGVIWVGRSMQFGLEAIIPINQRSGQSIGVLAQLHIFLDDIFARSLGRPMFP